jgi:flagellar P-ring protein precursor FlgI
VDLSVLARLILGIVAASVMLVPSPAASVRVKDIAAAKGVRGNQLIGYGLVVGLNGTGDRQGTEFTVQSLSSMLTRLGIGVNADDISVKNVAAVMVTAVLPPFARTGTRLDATISSAGDAKSLEGGTLLLTPLYGADGEVYSLAQGPLSVGGFSAGGGAGSSVQKNHPTVGRLANGATVERELPYALAGKESFELALSRADFTTARRMADAINERLGLTVARAPDPATVQVRIPPEFAGDEVVFMASIEEIEIDPDHVARVVVNERTGTIVMGAKVRLERVAVAHGNLSVTISAENDVSQPAPFSLGETVGVTNETITATEEEAALTVVDAPVTIDQLVRGLNALGVTPRDLIAILQAIKAAGALSADLEVI